MSKRIPELVAKNAALRNENDKLTDALVEMKNQYTTTSIDLRDFQSKSCNIPILEDKIRLLATENERLQEV